jgi:hypothetical protein
VHCKNKQSWAYADVGNKLGPTTEQCLEYKTNTDLQVEHTTCNLPTSSATVLRVAVAFWQWVGGSFHRHKDFSPDKSKSSSSEPSTPVLKRVPGERSCRVESLW